MLRDYSDIVPFSLRDRFGAVVRLGVAFRTLLKPTQAKTFYANEGLDSIVTFRRLVRGRIDWPRLEETVRGIAARYDEPAARVEFLEADNWLSTPCVVNDRWFVKLISPQNTLVHTFITTGRNLGAFASGTPGFFERCETPVEMVRREFAATERTREIGVNAPEPLDAFEMNGLGVLVLEYLPAFRSLDELGVDETRALAPALFESLSRLHADGLCHGDLQSGNVLVVDSEPYFIDATSVRDGDIDGARAYDLACALAVLAPRIGARETIRAAREHYSPSELLDAWPFLDFVNIRPDHRFDAAAVKGEIEKQAV